MRLKNEGKSTSKLWLVGGAVGAVALAAGAAMYAGTPRNTNPAGNAAPTTANAAPASEEHSADDGHGHGPDDGHNHGAENTTANASANTADNPVSKEASTNAASGNAATNTANAASTPTVKPAGKTSVTSSKVRNIEGMKVEDLKVGTGKEAKSGDNLTMDYRGTLENGTVFDESYKRGEPFNFTLGAGQVIQGWDKGVVGMKEGGKRRLTIPGDLAYGANSPSPSIPANATLIFEIELRKVG